MTENIRRPKDQLHYIADELPPDASIEEAIEKLIVLHKIEIGIKQADEGKTIPHEEVAVKLGNFEKETT
jgi:predicted transcriptional regulator